MIVYRVEDATGEGMYCSRVRFWPMIIGDGNANRNHPTPHKDAGMLANGWPVVYLGEDYVTTDWSKATVYYFGFLSLEQLKAWIYDMQWREELDYLGFAVVAYEIDPTFVIKGDAQCAFYKRYAHASGEPIKVTNV